MSKQLWNLTIGALLLLAATVPLGLLLAKPLPVYLGSVMVDDAFYYLVPAQNIVAGLGSSFDGVNQTNGYHPLWMLVSVASVWLTPESLHLYLLPALSGLLYLGGALLIAFRLFPQRSVFEKAVLFALFGFNFLLLKVFMQGLENGLNFFILALLLVFLQRQFSTSGDSTAFDGASLSVSLTAANTFNNPPPPPRRIGISITSGS